MDFSKLIIRHREKGIAHSHEKGAFVLPCSARQARRHVKDEDTGAFMVQLFNRNTMVKLFEKPCFGFSRLRECLCSYNMAWPLVGDAKNDLSSAFIR